MRLTPIFLVVALGIFSAKPFAQTAASVPAQTPPPTDVKAAAQPWLVYQDWYCRTGNQHSRLFIQEMQTKMSKLGAQGWELVSFSPTPVYGPECFVAMFKAPKKQ